MLSASLITSKPPERPKLSDKAWIYRPILVKSMYAEFGSIKLLSVFGSQVEQESAWNCEARSKYAYGCSQFTRDTADWFGATIGREYGKPRLNDPFWALPAMVRYMRHIDKNSLSADTLCDKTAMNLSGYNGGPRWVDRDRSLTQERGQDPDRWWDNVELNSARGKSAFEENRGYVSRVLLVLLPKYVAAAYGGENICNGKSR